MNLARVFCGITKWFLPSIFVAVFAFFLSLFLLVRIDIGDRVLYDYIFDNINSRSLSDRIILFRSYTGSYEPMSIFIFWLGSVIFDKSILFQASLNSILYFLLFRLLVKFHLPSIVYPILLTNFYVFVLFLSADRQKIGFIFLLLFMLCDATKQKALYITIAALSHFQYFLYIAPVLLYKGIFVLFDSFVSFKISRPAFARTLLFFLFVLLAACVVHFARLIDLAEIVLTISGKLERYSDINIYSQILYILMALFIGFILWPIRRFECFFFMSMLPFAFAIRQGKILILIFFVITGMWLLRRKRDWRWCLYLLPLSYLSFKSIALFDGVMYHGNPFYYLA